jgi:hypothetical protein
MVQRAGRRHGLQVAAAAFLFAAGCGSSAPATGDPCAALDCGTHGTCTDAGGTARCECAAGFTGASCSACLPEFFGGECRACTCVRGTCNDGIAGDGACTCPAPFAGASCDQCAASAASAIYLFNVGSTSVAAMEGDRGSIDALAQAALPTLPTTGTTAYLAHGFISRTGDAIRDFPASLCVPSGVPVLGVGTAGALTRLADDWADFTDGTIATTIGAALGFADFNYFWTGSHADGSASAHDCSGWTASTGDDATISRRANVTSDWLEEAGGLLASCSSHYFMLGLARCVGDCPP